MGVAFDKSRQNLPAVKIVKLCSRPAKLQDIWIAPDAHNPAIENSQCAGRGIRSVQCSNVRIVPNLVCNAHPCFSGASKTGTMHENCGDAKQNIPSEQATTAIVVTDVARLDIVC